MDQSRLFAESIQEAVEEVVRQLGGNKVVGSMLWPAMDPTDAGKKLSRCFNEHAQKLGWDEVDLILAQARNHNIHVFVEYIGQRYGYQIHPIEPQDERARLQREYVDAVNQLHKLSEQIGRSGLKVAG